MVHYKLTYFNTRGLAEMSRCVLHYAGIEFEDNQITPEDWPKFKASMPYGNVPVLEVDGIKITQSFAIARFLARRYGLAGKSDIESALLDSIADLHKDYHIGIVHFLMVAAGRAEGDKDKIFKETYKPAVEDHFPRLVKLLSDSGSGFYGKSGVSWIDFFMASEFLTTKNLAPELMKSYPELQKHCDRVHALPQFQSYFAKRKQTLL